MVSWWCWRSPKSGEPKVRKPQKNYFVCPPSAPSDYDSMSTLRVQPQKKNSVNWGQGKVFETITQLFRSEPYVLGYFAVLLYIEQPFDGISQFHGFFSQKYGGAATSRPCLAGIFPVLPIFGMNDLGCLKIGDPPGVSPHFPYIQLPFWSILGYPPLSDIPISLSANDLSILVTWDNLA